MKGSKAGEKFVSVKENQELQRSSCSHFALKIDVRCKRRRERKTEVSAIQEYEPSKTQGSKDTSIPISGTTNISHFVETLLTIVSFFFLLVKNTGDSTTINDVRNQSTDRVSEHVPRVRESKRVEWDSSANWDLRVPAFRAPCVRDEFNYFIKASRE